MADQAQMPVRCHGCAYFFITHEPQRPYGCTKFGFKAKKLPATIVIETTGTQCAYRKRVRPQRTGAGKTRGKSDGR